MKISLKHTLVAVIIAACISVPAFAQQGAAPALPAASTTTQAAPAVKAPGPCAAERKNVVGICRKNGRCSAVCLQAHEQMKACRAANNLPPPKPRKNAVPKPPCPAAGATTGTPPAAGSAMPQSTAPHQ